MTKKIIKNQKNLLPPLVLFLVGAMVVWQSAQYGLGSLSQMGSGYFPLWLGLLLMFFAVMIFWQDCSYPSLGASLPLLRSALLILVGFVAIAWLIERSGLAVSLMLAVPFFCYADQQRSLTTVIPIVIGTLVLCYVIFVRLLEMKIPF